MQAVSHAFNFATLLLVTYLIILVSNMAPSMEIGFASTSQYVAPLEDKLASQEEVIDALAKDVAEFRKETNDRIEKAEAAKARLKSLQTVINTVAAADDQRAAGNFADAAAALLGTKDAIWQAGDVFKDHQKTLRGLMGPIDVLAEKWNGGDDKTTAEGVISDLQKVYKAVGADQ